MRGIIYLLLCLGSVFLSSCLGNNEDEPSALSPDAQIYSFKLSDTLSVLKNTQFTIDQRSGRIFNIDSLPYGTVVNKVKCELTTNGASKIEVYQNSQTEPLLWNGSDSLDFSEPVRFVVYAQRAPEKKEYIAQVNIYTIPADSFVWQEVKQNIIKDDFEQQHSVLLSDSFYTYVRNTTGFDVYISDINGSESGRRKLLQGFPVDAKLNSMQLCKNKLFVINESGELYESADALQWNKVELTFSLVALLGALDGDLEAIVEDAQHVKYFGTYSLAGKKITQGSSLPNDFPVENFTSISYSRNFLSHLMVLGGINSTGQMSNDVWNKTKYPSQSKDWLKIVAPNASRFSARVGAVGLPYDDKLMLIGGQDVSGNYLKDIYFSSDQGINWELSDSLQVMPERFAARAGASAFIGNDNFVFIAGGKNATLLNDLWRGRIHRLAK
ncbi:MAG: DUF6242 domain-containing protein [Bacteroidales bacterium]|nr:DUF6242 domain-containing protein [Bacteroidales bacterium]